MAKSLFKLPFQVWSKSNFSFLRIQYTAQSEDQNKVSDHFCRCHGNEFQRPSNLNLLTGKTYTHFSNCDFWASIIGVAAMQCEIWEYLSTLALHRSCKNKKSQKKTIIIIQSCSFRKRYCWVRKDFDYLNELCLC